MSTRMRLWLGFGCLALVVGGVLAIAAWWAWTRPAAAGLVWGAALFALVVTLALATLLVDRRWLKPSTTLARELQLMLHAQTDRPLPVPRWHGLGPLAEAVAALADRCRTNHAQHERALAAALTRASEQQSRLEALLRDLSDGVIACSTDRRILLVNDAAVRILGARPELGLDRPLDRLIAREPITHAFDLLCERLDTKRGGRRDATREEFVCATIDGAKLLRCRMSLIFAPDGSASGFVLDFADITEQFGQIEERDAEIVRLVEQLRAPVAALSAATDVLTEASDLDASQRAAFLDVVSRESSALSERIAALGRVTDQLGGRDWPMADLYSADLARWVNRRFGPADDLRLTPVGANLWLHGDGYHLTLLLERLLRRIAKLTGVTAFDLEARQKEAGVELDLVWQGEPVALGTLTTWLDERLDAKRSGTSLHDAVRRHHSELWSQAHERSDHALLRMPLPAPQRPQIIERPAPGDELPPRPEFYDFALLERRGTADQSELDRPLAELSYVVFDTETTGLDPARDRVIQIAGVRIVNRRLLSGEVFDALINPRRPIPKASNRFHGITDKMVADRPPIEIVLPQFHAFARDSVLVAHNAAFDLAFLHQCEELCGLHFEQPTLDTLLLSAVLHDHLSEHTLDAIAERFGVRLFDRHKALGDAMGTAQILLRMLDLLAAEGIETLGDALSASAQAVEVRRRQQEQFGPQRGRKVVAGPTA